MIMIKGVRIMINGVRIYYFPFFYGLYLFIPAVIQFFVPTFGYSKKLIRFLERRKTLKAFLLSQRLIGLALGCTTIAGGILPDDLIMRICMPLLAIISIIALARNKLLLGTFVHHWREYERCDQEES